MTLYDCGLRRTLVASVSLILLIGFIASGKTVRRSHGTSVPSSSGDAVLDLSDFGAVGNGIADDGPALQRALDALGAAGGGTLLIPAGHYLIATPATKDFGGLSGMVRIQGVPSLTMPAVPTASASELSAGLDLTSDIIPATGESENAINLSNVHQLLIEHISFSGRPDEATDAATTLSLNNIDEATIRHCEFYGISTLLGGSIVRTTRSAMSIEQSVFLGCTANSGLYAPVVENIEWRKVVISNSIFLDYGQRPFFSKTGFGAPLSWINVGNAALPTPDSPRREIVVRDTFLDEGGWVGISVFPHIFNPPHGPIDLVFISGLKMNVSNLGSTGHSIYDARNVLIERSHYGWSHNADSAISINGSTHAILDSLTCIDHADVLQVDDITQRLTVINSAYRELHSLAQTTTVLETTPELDPVQYVRGEFVSALGRQPDPAAHFYWSDKLIRCAQDNNCVTQQKSSLSQYLASQPQPDFSLSGTVLDENGSPIVGATLSLTGSQVVDTVSDSQGEFRFSNLPTSGSYTVGVAKPAYAFTNSSQTVVHPAGNLNLNFSGRLNGHTISGRITRGDGTGISGVTLTVQQLPTTFVKSDANGDYVLPELAIGGSYTVVPVSVDFLFSPQNTTFDDLSANQRADFTGRPSRHTISGRITKADGTGLGGVTIALQELPAIRVTTDANGNYVLPEVETGGNYTVVPISTQYLFTPASQTYQNLSADQQASFVGRLRPQLVTFEGSDIAMAFHSITFAPEPFSLYDLPAFSSDRVTRLIIFARYLEGVSNLSQVSVVAEDQQGNTYPLIIEYMGDVVGQDWLKQLNIRLSPTLPTGGYIKIRVSVADATSDYARIKIAAP